MAASLLRSTAIRRATCSGFPWVDAATPAAALQSGQIDAALITAPAYFRFQAAGLPVLATLMDYDDIYVSTYYLFRRDALTKERPTAIAFIKAHAEAIKRFYDDRAFATETMINTAVLAISTMPIEYTNSFARRACWSRSRLRSKVRWTPLSSGQGQELKGVDFSKMIDNSLVDQSVKETISKLFSDRRYATTQLRKQAQAFGKLIVNCRRPTTRRLGEIP